MSTPVPDPTDHEEMDAQEFRRWAEYGCWLVLVLALVTWWLQGPSVSTDQFVVRSSLIVFAAIGAIGMRVCAFWQRRRTERCCGTSESTPHSPTDDPAANEPK